MKINEKIKQLKEEFSENYYDDDFLGSSALACLTNEVPAVFKRKFIDKIRTSNQAFFFGDMLHTKLLEPNIFDEKFMMLPKDIKRRSGAKWEAFKAENPNVNIATASDFKMVYDMQEQYNTNLDVNLLLDGLIDTEIPIMWESGGVKQRAKMDILTKVGRNYYGIDIKTTMSVKSKKFCYSVEDYCYDIQAAHYIEGFATAGINISKWFIIAIDKSSPYLCRVYEMGKDYLEYGRERRIKALSKYWECKKNDDWCGYKGVFTLQPPKWKLNK